MDKLVFLGTKGDIEESGLTHRYHSSLLILSQGTRLLIDYGTMHKHDLNILKPDTILITHAHPDHYIWVKEDVETNIPVYLTEETLEYGKFKPKNPKTLKPSHKFTVEPFDCVAYRVLHSIRCPAVGYKINTPDAILVYNPDLVDIIDKEDVLKGVDYYIGDGSSVKTNLVRKRGDKVFGHTRITTQVNWCRKHGISNIIFTHLGKETIEKESEFTQVYSGVILAYDGMELAL